MGRAALKTGFPNGTADYKISDGKDFVADIRAKDFPLAGENGEFRVYAVFGDITKPERLNKAIGNLLAARGIQRRRIIVNL